MVKFSFFILRYENGNEILIEIYPLDNTSVIRQKGESQSGFFKKTKHIKFLYVCLSRW